MNQSTRESSEDVSTYTWHTKSMVQIWAPFCSPKGNQWDWLRHLIQGVNGWIYYKEWKKGTRINSTKNPRRASVSAETRTYGTNSPSRWKSRALSFTPLHHLQKKVGSMTNFPHTWFHPHGSHRKMFTRTLDTPNPWYGWRFSPLPEGNQSNGWGIKSMAPKKRNYISGGRRESV